MDSVDRYLHELAQLLSWVPRDEVRRVIDAIREARDSGHTIFIMGNGGSAATASHMACDLAKTAMATGGRRIKVVSLTDNASLMTAWANDVSYEEVFAQQLYGLAEAGDLVVAISGSGRSANIVKAARAAREISAKTIAFTGCVDSPLEHLADICIAVPAGRIEQAEDAHVILDHVITVALREGMIESHGRSWSGQPVTVVDITVPVSSKHPDSPAA